MNLYRFLADLVVVVHFAYVAFVVLGFLLVLLGIVLKWGWVRNFWFRMLHFAAIGVVALQAVIGVLCPLTILERELRTAAGETVDQASFIGRWVNELLFYHWPQWVFTLSYCLFAAAVLATLWLAPPRGPRRRAGSDGAARHRDGTGPAAEPAEPPQADGRRADEA
jgi:hypothetical protein